MPTQLQKNTAARSGRGGIQQHRRFAGGHLGWDTLNIDGTAPSRSIPAGVSVSSANPAQKAAPAALSSSECTPRHD